MLDRIRVGCPTASDIETLKERIIPTEKTINEIKNAVNKYNEVSVKYPGLLVLLPKNAKVNRFNELMSKLKVANITSVNSIDVQKSTNSHMKQPNYICGKNGKKSTNQTAGLESKIDFGICSRIMLRRNLDIDKGLVNGALGTISNIIFDNNNPNFVLNIQVKFDMIDSITTLDRVTADFESYNNCYVTRAQFPICLAWAISIHKCQGLSLDAVLLDIGDDIF